MTDSMELSNVCGWSGYAKVSSEGAATPTTLLKFGVDCFLGRPR